MEYVNVIDHGLESSVKFSLVSNPVIIEDNASKAAVSAWRVGKETYAKRDTYCMEM